MDVLSDVITVMRTGRPSSDRLRLGSRWCYRFAPYDGAGFHVFLRGTGWLITDHGDPTPLGPGDVVLVPHGGAHVLSDSPRAEHAVPFENAVGEPDGPTDVLCGKYRLDRTRTHPVLARLPEVVHLSARAGRHAGLRAAIDLLGGEVVDRRPGRDAAVSGLLDLLLVYMVRAWLEDNAATGWPQALRDPTLAAALEALHADPARPWRLQDLAATAGLSRATLARRFTSLTGQSPMAYVAWWRMAVAARLLRDSDLSLPEIARRVGYGSPYAFAHAFKRHFGVAPGRYRAADQTAATA
ncbi:AraC family transcriptional regulator [Actinoallomurus sp. NBC_01490]|uniref:AraC family transcriptional regulator n=1 Tax=Actinoallomurus sp. NBC_01490 TaxID=2903557 RepID=UPI002E2EC104|nr:AraC family transcriptional regulator [Actinoallomurus sp. NBC_01490]